jgi:hypothetical protein
MDPEVRVTSLGGARQQADHPESAVPPTGNVVRGRAHHRSRGYGGGASGDTPAR